MSPMLFSLPTNTVTDIIVIALSIVLMVMAYRKRVLDRNGSIGAFMVGLSVGIFGGLHTTSQQQN